MSDCRLSDNEEWSGTVINSSPDNQRCQRQWKSGTSDLDRLKTAKYAQFLAQNSIRVLHTRNSPHHSFKKYITLLITCNIFFSLTHNKNVRSFLKYISCTPIRKHLSHFLCTLYSVVYT